MTSKFIERRMVKTGEAYTVQFNDCDCVVVVTSHPDAVVEKAIETFIEHVGMGEYQSMVEDGTNWPEPRVTPFKPNGEWTVFLSTEY